MRQADTVQHRTVGRMWGDGMVDGMVVKRAGARLLYVFATRMWGFPLRLFDAQHSQQETIIYWTKVHYRSLFAL